MKGWVTADLLQPIEVIRRFGRLKVLDDRELVVEVESMEDFQKLQALLDSFGKKIEVELMPKK